MVEGGASPAATLASPRETSHLTVTQTRELLESLRGVVKDFAAAEDKLNKDFRAKTDATEKRFKEDAAAHEAQLAAQLSEAETAYQSEKARIESHHEKRKTHIARAHKSSHKLSAKRIDDQEGHWKYKSQKGLLDTKRFRTDTLAQNDATFAEFGQQLADSRGTFAALEGDAQKAFRGYGKFRRQLEKGEVLPNTDFAPDEHQLLQKLQQLRERTSEDLTRFQKLFLPKLFRVLPLWLWLVLLLVAGLASEFVPALALPGKHLGAIGAGAIAVLAVVIYCLGIGKGKALAKTIADELTTAQRVHDICLQKSQTRHAQEVERIETEAKNSTEMFQENWRSAVEQAANARELWPVRIDEKWQRVVAKNDAQHTVRLARAEGEHTGSVNQIRSDAAARQKQFTDAHEGKVAKFNADYQAHWEKLEADWKQLTQPIFEAIAAANETAKREFPEWQRPVWQNWKPPGSFKNLAQFARLEADVKKLAEAAPCDPRLAFPPVVSLPLLLTYPQQGSILFETTKSGNEPVVEAINNIMFRLISTAPAGKLSFTIIDPVKLGQNFAGVMHLADYEDNLINSRILDAGEPDRAAARRAERAHGEGHPDVSPQRVRDDRGIQRAGGQHRGEISLPRRRGFSGELHRDGCAAVAAHRGERRALRRFHADPLGPAAHAAGGFFPGGTAQEQRVHQWRRRTFRAGESISRRHARLARCAAGPEFATEFLHKVGKASRGSNRVEVPFAQIAPPDNEIWTEETTDELRVPIGRTGATKLQYLAIGKGTRQHALIAGKTGSGKSTLFHVIITNLALWCSPEQVEFYLVDFKKGVEFKCYATNRLPHARSWPSRAIASLA